MQIRLTTLLMLTISSLLTRVSLAEEKTYELPKDPKAVVISFDWKGGFTPPRQKEDPVLSILADGTVLMPDRYGQSQDFKGKISQKELQDLLRFAIDANHFFEIDKTKIKNEIEAAQKAAAKANPGQIRSFAQIADAPSSVFSISLSRKSHQVSYYALSFASSQHKTVKSLKQLLAIQQRLNHLMNLTRLGGQEKLEAALSLVNAELKKEFPKAPPLKAEDLQGAYVRNTGILSVTFSRTGMKKDGTGDGTFTRGGVEYPVDGAPKVSVLAKLKP